MTDDDSLHRAQLEHEVATALYATTINGEISWTVMLDELVPELCLYSNGTLRRFIGAAHGDIGYALLQMLLYSKYEEGYLNDWITLAPLVTQQSMMSTAHPVASALHNYPHLEPMRNGQYPQRRVEQATALLLVTDHLYTGVHVIIRADATGTRTATLADSKLGDLITTHENPALVADLIISRNVTDTDQLLNLLIEMGSTAAAVSTGVL